MVVLIEKNEKGKIELTKEELEQLLEQARQEGIREAQKPNGFVVNPCVPLTCPNGTGTPYVDWNKFTCQSLKQIGAEDTTTKINGIPTSSGL